MLVIGDVCGKGPRAAGVTALARHTLRAASMGGQSPAEMLGTLHRGAVPPASRRGPLHRLPGGVVAPASSEHLRLTVRSPGTRRRC